MTDKEKIRELRKEKRELKTYLERLTAAVTNHIREIDKAMKLPATPVQGGIIAQMIQQLEMEKDAAKRYGLRLDWDGKPFRRTKPKTVAEGNRRAKRLHRTDEQEEGTT